MKFPLHEETEIKAVQKDDSRSVVSCEAEYYALREEKIFRYGYSNQLNTTLLTITLTIFSIGIVCFSMDTDDPLLFEFAMYFFPVFFLIPCFFAKICFRYALRNSIRIGILSEYMRKHIKNQNEVSWETIKKDKELNYFYKNDCKIGGVKDLPICITIISIFISVIIGRYPTFSCINENIKLFFLMLLPLVPILLLGIEFQLSRFNNNMIQKILSIVMWLCFVISIYCFVIAHHLDNYELLIKQAVYDLTLFFTVVCIPNYKNELRIANEALKKKQEKI